MSAQVYSLLGQTERGRKASVEGESIDLSFKLSLTYRGNVNYCKYSSGETFCSLPVACCLLLFSRCSLLFSRCSLLFARCSLLLPCCSLLFPRFSLLFARCSFLANKLRNNYESFVLFLVTNERN